MAAKLRLYCSRSKHIDPKRIQQSIQEIHALLAVVDEMLQRYVSK